MPPTEKSSLLGPSPSPQTKIPRREEHNGTQSQRIRFIYAIVVSATVLASIFILNETAHNRIGTGNTPQSPDNQDETTKSMAKNSSPLLRELSPTTALQSALEEAIMTATTTSPPPSTPPYSKVQTLSFQIYTGGAPAFIPDDEGLLRRNHECKGLHSYGRTEADDKLEVPSEKHATIQCYLGLDNTTEDIHRRLSIVRDAVDKAYDLSNKDESTLKIFLAPEFFFRGKDGSFHFNTKELEEAGHCSDVCHLLKGLEEIVAHQRFENWLFLFGTVIASEQLPKEDKYDYKFYNFAPLYKGFDPVKSKRIGKNFLVPKRYVSNIDFFIPLRHLKDKSNVVELLDDYDQSLDRTLPDPREAGNKRYNNHAWIQYKDQLTSLGYEMIEYGWFVLDGINFSVEICLDHLVHRALMTYAADVVTGSKTRIPSSFNGTVEWVGIPKKQAQISLVSSASMDVVVASLALADGGHIFLQDGVDGDLAPYSTYGTDQCQPNEYEFFGGSQSITRTAVVSPTDVTFAYSMNMNFTDHLLYPDGNGHRHWKEILKGVFSATRYQPKLTVYEPVDVPPQ